MRARRARPTVADPDGLRVRRTARQIGWRVAAATAVLGVLGVMALFALVIVHARHEGAGPGSAVTMGTVGQIFRAGLVIDLVDLVTAVAIVGAAAVVAIGVIGWYAARRAVAPLGAALRSQRNFVTDASHELRTPLTVLDGRVQILQRRLARHEPVEELATQLRADTSVMRETLDDLLLAAEQAETGQPQVTDATAVCRDLVGSLAGVVEEPGVGMDLAGEAQADVRVRVPEATLRRCVMALVDNAVQHTPAGGRVTVSVTRSGPWCEIRVADTGPGIVGVPVEQVFDRFAHSHGVRQRRSFGLGLALTRDVTVRAGGDVAVESTSTSGTVLRLRLPLAE